MSNIEKLIQQDKFSSEQHKAVVSIMYVSNLINYNSEQVFKRYGITGQQYNVLRILRGQHPKPCTVSLIRERMIDRMSDASRIVERLRKLALVQRITSAKDRRSVDVAITDDGLKLLSNIDRVEHELLELFAPLTAKETQQLNMLLDKMLPDTEV